MACMVPFAAVVLLASTIGCSALRPEPAVNAGRWAIAVSAPSLKDLAHEMIESVDHHEDVPFTLLTKYIIRPSIAKEFAGGWLKFREVVVKAKGSKTIRLNKPLTDNVVFYSYEEWHCKKDFFEFAKNSSAVKDLASYIEDHDIPVTLTQLVPAVPNHKSSHASVSDFTSQIAGMSMQALVELIDDAQNFMPSRKYAAEAKSRGKKAHKHHVIVLTKFLVKPSGIEEFVKAVHLVTKAISKHEKGNLAFGVWKPLDDDVTFWGYAVWKDEAALEHHVKTCHCKSFHKYILEHDIYTKTTPLLPIEHIDE